MSRESAVVSVGLETLAAVEYFPVPMSFFQRIAKQLPSSPSLPLDDAASREKGSSLPRFDFFRRRIRLKGNSSISIPLGFVLLFPCLVIVLILLLFVRHPSSPGGILIPAGTPPSIRFALAPFQPYPFTSQ